ALDVLDGIERPKRGGERREQDTPPRVQRIDAEAATARGEDERRIDEPDVPPRVASRVLVARGQEHTAALLEPVDERLDGVRDGNLLDRSVDADASPSVVRRGGHDLPPPCEESADSGRQKNESRPEWAAPFSLGSALVRARAGRAALRGTATTTASARSSDSRSRSRILADSRARRQAQGGHPTPWPARRTRTADCSAIHRSRDTRP